MFKGVEGEIKRRQLMRDFPSFVEFVNDGFCMTKFHRYVCEQVQEFLQIRTGKALDILLLSVPPRHGKSHMITATLPVWFMGNNPRNDVIIASYQSIFSEGFNKQCRDKFNRFAPYIFKAQPDKHLQRGELWGTEVGGRCRAAGLEGGITGHGADLFIIDDPIKNAKEASSETIVRGILAEMGPSVQSRIHPNGKLIVIQTRWVENDVIGFIKDNWADYIWKDINLPCEYDEEEESIGPCPLGRKIGDSLMGPHMGDPPLPDKIANTNEWLRSKKALVVAAEGLRVWTSLYQGRPTSATGNIFDSSWWGAFRKNEFVTERQRETLLPYEIARRKTFEYLQLSIDATFKGGDENDFVAMGLRGIYQGKIYLYHQVNKRMGFVETMETIKWFYENFPEIDEMVIEDKANGPAIADVLRYVPDAPPVVCVNPMGGKVSRAEAIAYYVKAGMVLIAEDLDEDDVHWHVPTDMTAREKIIYQHKSFPFGKHDDLVDECSQGVVRLIKLITGEEPKQERRFIRYTKWYPDMWEDFERMSSIDQEKFVQTYGAPEEWMCG